MNNIAKFARLSVFICLVSATAPAQVTLNYGSLVVYRVGTGSGTLTNASTQVSILEFSQSGSLLQTITMPTSGSNQLTSTGNDTNQGKLRYNGRFLAVPGFDAPIATANVAATSSAAVQRRVVVLENDPLGVTQIANLGSAYNASAIRAAIPQANGSGVWSAGVGAAAVRGIWYHDFSSSTNTQVSNTNLYRSLTIHNAQLYAGSTIASGNLRQIGTGLPTTSAANTALPGSPLGRAVAFVDLPGGPVAYVTTDSTSISKYSFDGVSWVLDGASPVSGAGNFLDLTALVDSSGNVRIFAVTASRLMSFYDTSGYAQPWSAGSWASLAVAGTGYAFRGITSIPEFSALMPSILAALLGSLIRLCLRTKVTKSHESEPVIEVPFGLF